MGKTSTVREALRELDAGECSDKNYTTIDIALSQDDVQELDILRQLARQLYLKWLDIYDPIRAGNRLQNWVFGLFILFTMVLIWWAQFPWSLYWRDSWIPVAIQCAAVIAILILFYIFIDNTLVRNYRRAKSLAQKKFNLRYNDILKRLYNLNARLDAKVLNERSIRITPQTGFSLDGVFSVSRLGPMGMETKNALAYEIASAKEIEKELILILEDIHLLRRQAEEKMKSWKETWWNFPIIAVPLFLFIIDELDKIEPEHFNLKEGDVPLPYNQKDELSQQRKRQRAVAQLLANLKSFLNSAKAKFIFIGGREMYDASLADVSDRESFYSSIFSKVINIESFFKDKLQMHSGVTGMTEAFTARQLIPAAYRFRTNPQDEFQREPDTLLKFYRLLQQGILQLAIDNELLAKPKEIHPAKNKLVFFLQNWLIFLTYRSNGSPKRLTEIFEKYIVSGEKVVDENNAAIADGIIVRFSSGAPSLPAKRLFLRFGFIKQYEISFTSNLYRPYLILNSRHMKLLDDKLLYSSAFILDHILKFHNHAFSWRNLELIPDIILINKDPNLRFFLQDIMKFLSQMHIRETVNAIFQYKFFSKVRNEIKLLSKVSPLSSAAFNFTLDESYHIKAWYRGNLQVKLQEYQEYENVMGAGTYVHAIGYLKNILGDIHFYDREYDEAIVYYTGVIQPFRARLGEGKSLTNHQVALYVRTKLKIGLCLEKIQQYDSAYSIYRTLILNGNKLVGQAQQRRVYAEQEQTLSLPLYSRTEWEKPYRRMQLFLRPHIALLDVIEKQRADGVTRSNLQRNIQDYCRFLEIPNKFPSQPKKAKPKKKRLRKKKVREVKEPRSDQKRIHTLLADYYNNVGSILYYKNKNFRLLHRAAMGDSFGRYFTRKFRKPDYDLYKFTDYLRTRHTAVKDLSLYQDYYPTLSAFIYYEKALRELLEPYSWNIKQIADQLREKKTVSDSQDNDVGGILNENIYEILINVANEPYCAIFNNTVLYFIGNLINKMGDALLSCISRTTYENINKQILDTFLLPGDSPELLPILIQHTCNDNQDSDDPIAFFSINRVLATYRLASMYYEKAGREYSRGFQYKKLLYIVKDYLTFFKNKQTCITELGEWCLSASITVVANSTGECKFERIATLLFHSITRTSNVSNRPQIEKYHEIFNLDDVPDEELEKYRSIYVNLSTSSEIREVIILVEEIRLKLFRLRSENNDPRLDNLSPKSLLSSNDLVSSMFCRMLELKYRSEYNWWKFTNLIGKFLKEEGLPCDTDHMKDFIGQMSTKHMPLSSDAELFFNTYIVDIDKPDLCKIIADSIFCLWETSRIFKNYEISYIANNSFQANAYYKLGNWVELFKKYQKVQEKILKNKKASPQIHINDIDKEVYGLIGDGAKSQMDQYFFYELAIQAYQRAIQMHRQGKAYKDITSNMHFLEDDFNDNLTHFSAATERFRINIGAVRYKIESLTEALASRSRVYQYKYYVPKE